MEIVFLLISLISHNHLLSALINIYIYENNVVDYILWFNFIKHYLILLFNIT